MKRFVLIGAFLVLSALICTPALAQKGVIADVEPDDTRQGDLLIKEFFSNHTGDYPEMAARHVIRILIAPNRSTYFTDDTGQVRGLEYDLFKQWEKKENARRPKGEPPVTVSFIPVTQAEAGDALIEGRGDILSLSVITPEREAKYAYATPIFDHIRQVVVTRAGGPVVTKLEDLSGRDVYVSQGTASADSVRALNERLASAGLAPARMIECEPYVTQENLMEMIHAGIIPACVVLEPFANLWSKVFKDLVIHSSIPLAQDLKVAWAVRKENPELLSRINAVIAAGLKKDEKMFERRINQYFMSTRWVSNPFQKGSKSRLIAHFRQQAEEFGIDWIKLMAQSFQESALNQNAKSPYGAMGIMQVLPSTAKYLGVSNYGEVQGNIRTGAKYLKLVMDDLAKESEVSEQDRFFFALAAYNMGSGRLSRYRARAAEFGYDPNRWFDNVERVALRKGNLETVMYVRNIVIYALAYQTAYDEFMRNKQLIGGNRGTTGVPAKAGKATSRRR